MKRLAYDYDVENPMVMYQEEEPNGFTYTVTITETLYYGVMADDEDEADTLAMKIFDEGKTDDFDDVDYVFVYDADEPDVKDIELNNNPSQYNYVVAYDISCVKHVHADSEESAKEMAIDKCDFHGDSTGEYLKVEAEQD